MDPPYGGCVCVCVFIKLHITAQPGPVTLIFQCYSNGSSLWGMCVCVFIKLHMTAQPGPVLTNLSIMLQLWIRPMGDQWLELRRQLLISRDKGDTLSRRFRIVCVCVYVCSSHPPVGSQAHKNPPRKRGCRSEPLG